MLATQPSPAQPVAAAAPPAPVVAAPEITTTTTVAPPPTTMAAPPPTPAAPKPSPATTVPAPRVTAPPTTAAPRPVQTHSGREACGWQWDGLRIDDGSSNEVTMNLDAARRPNETVTIKASFAGPDSPDASHTVMTDADGQASTTFTVSEDKRDWTITISASFAAGGYCEAQTFTLEY